MEHTHNVSLAALDTTVTSLTILFLQRSSARDPGGRARPHAGQEEQRDQDVEGYRQTASTRRQIG